MLAAYALVAYAAVAYDTDFLTTVNQKITGMEKGREYPDNMANRKNVAKLDDAFAYYVNRTYRLLRIHFLEMTKRAGRSFTPEQYFLMNKLWHHPDQPQSSLAADLNDRANVTRGLDVLEKEGLIQRLPDPGDRRKTLVRLTKEGNDWVLRLNPIIMEERKIVYAGLSSKDLEMTKRILKTIEDNLRGTVTSTMMDSGS